MRKRLFLSILIVLFFFCQCFRIEPPLPDLTPPTAFEVDISETDVIKITWYLIRDDNTDLYDGVNIYYYKVAVQDDTAAHNYFIGKWTAKETDCIIKDSTGNLPSVTSDYYDDNGVQLSHDIQVTDIETDGTFDDGVDNFYLMLTSSGTYNGITIESQLSEMVYIERVGGAWTQP